MLQKLYKLCVALCRLLTRQECAKRREQVAEVQRWSDAARTKREIAQRRLDAALMDQF